MNKPCILRSLLSLLIVCSFWGPNGALAQVKPVEPEDISFPGSVSMSEYVVQSIEFCPDNTCIQFVGSKDVSRETLEDFAYLYIYFFSDYYSLDEWRAGENAKSASQQVIFKYHGLNCKSDTLKRTASCLLLELSKNGRIYLFSVRYDENLRNLTPLNIPDMVELDSCGREKD